MNCMAVDFGEWATWLPLSKNQSSAVRLHTKENIKGKRRYRSKERKEPMKKTMIGDAVLE